MNSKATALIALSVFGLSTLGTQALWHDKTTADAGVVTSGNLEVNLVGPVKFSPGLESETPTGNASDQYLAPGEPALFLQDFNTTLDGDNITGKMTVEIKDRSGEQGFYEVINANGESLGGAALGEPTVVSDLPAANGKPYTIKVLALTKDPNKPVNEPWSPLLATNSGTEVTAGTIQVTLDQARSEGGTP